MTLIEAIQEGMVYCAASETAKLDAQLLLCHVLQVERAYLYTWPDQVLTENQETTYQELLQQRASGQPIAYLLGYRDFWTFRLAVNNSTLIPRPETEGVVETCLALGLGNQAKVLELGTGTGAIALALGSEQTDWWIDAVELSPQAVQLAQKNCATLGIKNVRVVQSSWFQAITDKDYDLIVANPPYIDTADPHLKQGDVRFEPRTALVAEDAGLADIKHITAQGKRFLKPRGWLVFEHGFTQAEDIRDFFQEQGYQNIQTQRDYAGLERITYAQWNKKDYS